jgi:hypothetical protein
MMRLRFPVSALVVSALALSLAGAPANAQEAQPAPRIDDIQISQAGAEAGGGVSILVKLSQQPKSASAIQVGGALVVQIDGITLPVLAFDPASNLMVRHVTVTPSVASDTPGSRIRFEGAAFAGASTTIYRNAVLVEAKLAEPSLPASSSLMAAGSPKAATPKPLTIKPPTATPSTPAALKPAPTVAMSQPSDAKTADAKPNALESHVSPVARVASVTAARTAGPTPPTPPVAPTRASATMATIAKLDTAACASAEAQLAKDSWSLPALGNRALCLIDQQKYPEAKNRLDQLAAFSPEDWRVELGRAALAAQKGDASAAEIGYRNAAQLAPDEATRAAIKQMLVKLTGPGA